MPLPPSDLPMSTQPDIDLFDFLGLEFVQESFGFLEVLRIKSFGEPVVRRRHKIKGFFAFTLELPQSGETRSSAKLPRPRLLFARPCERSEVVLLGALEIAFQGQHPALEAQEFGIVAALFPT